MNPEDRPTGQMIDAVDGDTFATVRAFHPARLSQI